jgi:hypothetical protein
MYFFYTLFSFFPVHTPFIVKNLYQTPLFLYFFETISLVFQYICLMALFKILLFPVLALGIFLSQVSSSIILMNYLANKEYISKNLCENRDKPEMDCCGKCVVKKELDKDSQQDKVPNFSKEKEVAKMAVRNLRLNTLPVDPFHTTSFTYLLSVPYPSKEITIPPPKSI